VPDRGRCGFHHGPRPAAKAHDKRAPVEQLVAPEGVGDGDGRLVKQLQVGYPALKEEGVVEAEQGDAGPLGVAGRVRGQRGQLALGLGRPALEMRGLGGHEARAEAGALGDGRAGQLLGQGMVVAGPGGDRSGLQEAGAAAAAGETQ